MYMFILTLNIVSVAVILVWAFFKIRKTIKNKKTEDNR